MVFPLSYAGMIVASISINYLCRMYSNEWIFRFQRLIYGNYISFQGFSTALMRGTPGDIYLMSEGRALALNFGIFLTRDRSYFISPQLIHLGHAAELPHVLRQRCPSASIDMSSSAVRSICQSEAGGMVLAHALEADRLLKQAHRQAAAPR